MLGSSAERRVQWWAQSWKGEGAGGLASRYRAHAVTQVSRPRWSQAQNHTLVEITQFDPES